MTKERQDEEAIVQGNGESGSMVKTRWQFWRGVVVKGWDRHWCTAKR